MQHAGTTGNAKTSQPGDELTIDEEVAKLALVVETAREIWG
jgi:hypothetical protein